MDHRKTKFKLVRFWMAFFFKCTGISCYCLTVVYICKVLPQIWNKVFRNVSQYNSCPRASVWGAVEATIINTLMLHKRKDFIDRVLTKHIPLSHFFFSWRPLSWSLAAFLPDTTHHHLLSPSPSISPLSLSLSLVLPPSCRSVMITDDSLAVAGENVVDPGHQRADFGVNARVVGLSAALAPRDDTLQLPITHQRTTRVTLSRGEEEHWVY